MNTHYPLRATLQNWMSYIEGTETIRYDNH